MPRQRADRASAASVAAIAPGIRHGKLPLLVWLYLLAVVIPVDFNVRPAPGDDCLRGAAGDGPCAAGAAW